MAHNQINLIEIDKMFDALAKHSWAESRDVWNLELCRSLARECQNLLEQGQLRKAAIGAGPGKMIQEEIRGDFTHWLNAEPATPAQGDYLAALQHIQQQLNSNFYLGLNNFETHFALYPPTAGYDKHIDNHRGTNARKITFVLYLNEDWSSTHAGRLCLFEPTDDKTPLAFVEPVLGNFILFRSDLFPHQVEKSTHPRLSLTGWFRNDAL